MRHKKVKRWWRESEWRGLPFKAWVRWRLSIIGNFMSEHDVEITEYAMRKGLVR